LELDKGRKEWSQLGAVSSLAALHLLVEVSHLQTFPVPKKKEKKKQREGLKYVMKKKEQF
jgi:hypothetical protein